MFYLAARMVKAWKLVSILVVLALVLSLGIVAMPQGTTEASGPPCTCGDICVNETGWWRNGSAFNASSTPIQDAVNNASGGETICVKDGNYHENVDVNTANLTIQSENGAANCVVNATDSNDHVFYVTASYVSITGFTVENATGGSRAGIYLGSGTAHCNISSNKATNNYYGISLYYSSNNMLTNNTANSNSFYSIYLCYSSNNTLINNTASHNTGTYGIYLASSNNNTLQNNDGEDNDIGIRLSGSSNNTLENNTANSNDYGIWLCTSSSNNTIDNNTANSNDYGIWLCTSSSNNTLTNNTAYNNTGAGSGSGIFLSLSSNNTLEDNTANSNHYGIYLGSSSSNNTITSNTVCDNDFNGIRLVSSSSNNTIYNNYFNNTPTNAWDNGANTWNTTNSTGPNIVGGPYIGGNYWSDYNGSDANGDGFGDTPHDIIGGSNKDRLPLILTGATLEGHVSFPGASQGPRWVRGLDVRFFNSTTGNETAWSPMNATTNSTGVFTITGIAPDSYNVSIKNWTCLSEVNTSVTLTAGSTTVVHFGMTREGDSNNDDWIVLADRTILYTGWGTQQGDAGWNAHCDFNRDGWLTLADRTIMYTYWAQHGD